MAITMYNVHCAGPSQNKQTNEIKQKTICRAQTKQTNKQNRTKNNMHMQGPDENNKQKNKKKQCAIVQGPGAT